jgi:hypothetical protein
MGERTSNQDDLTARPGQASMEPMHMTLCEFAHLVPRPGQVYIGVHIPGCEECDRLAEMQREAYGASSPTVAEDGSLVSASGAADTDRQGSDGVREVGNA